MRRSVVFRPISLLYYAFLSLLLLLMVPYFAFYAREVLVNALGMSVEMVGFFLLASLLGSNFNIPLFKLESSTPIYVIESTRFFGVNWRVPQFKVGVKKTLVTLNIGGALVPVLVSLYLLFWSVPVCSVNPLATYLKALFIMGVVALVVYRTSRVIRGLGIATPAFIPPMVTALTTYLVFLLSQCNCPAQIAYIGGTLGTLIGADLMNIRKFSTIGAPVVSIGGAGTFDGVYTTGLISVLLVLLLL